ncbi:hypothetical protein M3Y97_00959800 [Aphelenchoides bicaudatus]|nr:hypothetical protein M3Y97_00959800 [Aphelenchoides bicaudatus]
MASSDLIGTCVNEYIEELAKFNKEAEQRFVKFTIDGTLQKLYMYGGPSLGIYWICTILAIVLMILCCRNRK